MKSLKYLIVAGLLATLTGITYAGDPPPVQAFKIERGFNISPNPVAEPAPPPKAAKPDCGCGPDCGCPPGACPGACDLKVKAASPKETWYACQVSTQRDARTTAYGSGTPLAAEGGKSIVLTNAHVVRDATKPITVHLNGKKYPARYVIGSTVTDVGPNQIHVDGPDLCVLEVDADLGGVELADAEPAEGEPVFQMGYGGSSDGQPIKRTGVVVAPKYSGNLNTTIPVVQGDSGCGVFDKYGCLCGVTHGGNGTIALAETVTTVRTYMTSSTSKPKFALFPRLRARLEEKKAAREAARAPLPDFSATPPKFDAAPPKVGATGSGIPPKPNLPGDWQWDAAKKQWWKWSTPNVSGVQPVQGGFAAPVQGSCPNGKCPNVAPPSTYRRW